MQTKANRAATLVALAALAACGGGAGASGVAAVQLQSTYTNPYVGETTHVGATPVDEHGIAVPGVGCAFASSNPAVATIDATSGAVAALSAGATVITAACGGKAATVNITVRPNEVALTIQKQGNGTGAVFANPPGTPTFVRGTSIRITATANSGSTFVAWGGACAAVAAPGACDLVMNADTTVTATFALSERFVSNTWSASLGTVTDGIGCQYAISASGVLTLNVVENSNGSVSGTGSTTAHIGIVTVYTPPYDTCTSLPFDTSGTGNLGGNDASLTASLASSGGGFTLAFTGTRSGTTITGSATVHETLSDGSGTSYPTSGATGGFTATKQ
jgi:hypothetical protein